MCVGVCVCVWCAAVLTETVRILELERWERPLEGFIKTSHCTSYRSLNSHTWKRNSLVPIHTPGLHFSTVKCNFHSTGLDPISNIFHFNFNTAMRLKSCDIICMRHKHRYQGDAVIFLVALTTHRVAPISGEQSADSTFSDRLSSLGTLASASK